MQRIASAVTLAVAALNAANSMALPTASEEMDILERDFDDFADLEARDAGAWNEDLVVRAGKPMVKSTHPAPTKTSAELEPNSTASIIASGVSAEQSEPTASSSAQANGTVNGAPSKTVTKERTITAKPTPCGGKGKGGKGKGKGGKGKKQPGRGARPSGPTGAKEKNKRAAASKHRPAPKAAGAPRSLGASAGASASLPHASASASAPSEGDEPEATPAPAASGAPADRQATSTAVTKTGKDGVVTVNKVTLVRPTSCAGPQKPGPGAGGRKKKGGNGKKPNGGKKPNEGKKPNGGKKQGRGFSQLKGATVTKGAKASPGKRELGWLDYMRRQSTSWVSGNREDARREVGGEGALFERTNYELDELD